MTDFDGSIFYVYLKFLKKGKRNMAHLSNTFHGPFLRMFSARKVSLVSRNNLRRNSLKKVVFKIDLPLTKKMVQQRY